MVSLYNVKKRTISIPSERTKMVYRGKKIESTFFQIAYIYILSSTIDRRKIIANLDSFCVEVARESASQLIVNSTENLSAAV